MAAIVLAAAWEQANPEMKARANLLASRLRFPLGQDEVAQELALAAQDVLQEDFPLLPEICQVPAKLRCRNRISGGSRKFLLSGSELRPRIVPTLGVYMSQGQFALLIAIETEVCQMIG